MEDLAQQTTPDPQIPDKLYFRIGEVAKLTGIKPYVLRFWESEFPGLGPKKSGTGHRLYRRKDVELVLKIKRLLYEKRFTIEGARRTLHASPHTASARAETAVESVPLPAGTQGELFTNGNPALLGELKRELMAILQILAAET